MTMTRQVLAPLRPAARVLTGSTYVLLGFDALRGRHRGQRQERRAHRRHHGHRRPEPHQESHQESHRKRQQTCPGEVAPLGRA